MEKKYNPTSEDIKKAIQEWVARQAESDLPSDLFALPSSKGATHGSSDLSSEALAKGEQLYEVCGWCNEDILDKPVATIDETDSNDSFCCDEHAMLYHN